MTAWEVNFGIAFVAGWLLVVGALWFWPTTTRRTGRR